MQRAIPQRVEGRHSISPRRIVGYGGLGITKAKKEIKLGLRHHRVDEAVLAVDEHQAEDQTRHWIRIGRRRKTGCRGRADA